MKTIEKSILVGFSANQMFDLVCAIDQYPAFLPWCDHAQISAYHDDGVTAEIGMAYSKLKQRFSTRNTHIPGRQIHLQLVSGPFSNLDGYWRFAPVGDTSDHACRTSLSLRYGFDNPVLAGLVGPVFDKIAANLVDAFFKRAHAVYG
jgi:ribosome-associated toxin RatA of RatAB toxin-antitoxin module